MRKKKERKRPGKKVSVIPRKTAVSADLTQAICSIMTLLQGISTPEEDCFIQVSVFVPEGRLWLLVWKAQSNFILGPLQLSCIGFAHPTACCLHQSVNSSCSAVDPPRALPRALREHTPLCGDPVLIVVLKWGVIFSVGGSTLIKVSTIEAFALLWNRKWGNIWAEGCTSLISTIPWQRKTLLKQLLCKGSTVLVVFRLWARHRCWQMSCQSTLSPHICVIMTWKGLEAGNLRKQWKWVVEDAFDHGMRTMHYLVKARHDILSKL